MFVMKWIMVQQMKVFENGYDISTVAFVSVRYLFRATVVFDLLLITGNVGAD